jgi:hypothetical protein
LTELTYAAILTAFRQTTVGTPVSSEFFHGASAARNLSGVRSCFLRLNLDEGTRDGKELLHAA